MAGYAGQYVPQGSAYGQGYHQSPSKPELPRSISTTNLETTRQCQDFVSKDLCSHVPTGGTYFFMDLPGYTFTVPYLTAYPPDFRQFVFDRIVDKTAKKALEDEKCLNWCQQATKLEPLHTKGDGNCLLHAASLGMWGFQDRANILRNAVSQAVQHATSNSNTLYPRWRYNKSLECRQQGFALEPTQWQSEWDTVVRQASCDPTATATLYSLEEFHVFVLANVLRRPVIMYASQKMRSIHTGGTMQCINFHGVYLPLLWDPNSCKKDPLPLAYQNGHFSALVVIDFAQQYRDGKLVLPLVSCDGHHLPVRFMLQDESPQSLLNDYMSIIYIAYSHMHIPCASLCVNTKPAYYDRLVGAFIDVCHSAYLQQQQQPQQYPYGMEVSGSDANGYPTGKVVGDGMYAHTASTTGPIESSYSVVKKDQIWDPSYSQGTAMGSEQSNKIKCINSCGMFGDPTTAGLCSKCYKKSLDAELQQGTTHVRQLRPSTSDSGFNSSASLTASGSIKCPNCSRPGHPNFLGMCESCYNGSQVSNQRQPEQQPATQQEYRNQTFQPQQYEQPQHLVQPVYGNQQQPFYGNDSDIQPQYGNQGASQTERPYESLDKYQKPTHSPHLQAPREDPPPLPLPRSTASSNERNKCRTPNCDFYGTAETRYYCSKCFERDITSIFSEVDKPAPAVPNRSYQPHPPQYHTQPVTTGASPMMQSTSPQHSPAEKCSSCHDYFGAPEYGGLCHGCFKNKTKGDSNPTKCNSCNDFFGSEEYGGLCNGCFLKKTENETTGTPHLPHAPPTCNASIGSDMNLPSAAFTFGDSFTPIQLPPKPEQSQKMLQPNYAGAPPAQYGHPQQYPHLQSHQVNTAVTQAPPPGNRPVPKPRNRTVMNVVRQQPVVSTHTYTAPVAADTLSPAVAAINISNEVCFLCTRTNPDATKSYSLCQMHAQLVTKQISTASQGNVGGPPLQNPQVQQNPNTFNQFPIAQGGHIQTSSGYNATPPIPPRGQVGQYSQTPSVPGPNYVTSSAGNQQLLAPQYTLQPSQPPQSSQPHYSSSGSVGGANLPYNSQYTANSQFSTGTAAMKPKPQPSLDSQLTPHSVAGSVSGANQPPYNSSQQYHVAGQYPQPGPSHYSGYKQQNLSPPIGGGAMLNNLNTNTSGTGISALQEEMSTIGSGAHSQLHQGHGIAGGGGVIGGGGGNHGIIQSGVPAGDSGASGVSGSAPRAKILCRTAGCSFYANEDLEGLCSNCYEEYYEVKPPEEKH